LTNACTVALILLMASTINFELMQHNIAACARLPREIIRIVTLAVCLAMAQRTTLNQLKPVPYLRACLERPQRIISDQMFILYD